MATPKIRLKGFSGEWKTAKIGTIAPITGGYAFQSDCFVNNGVPIVRISNILASGVVGGDFAFYDSFPGDEQFKLHKDDILIAMSGATTGKVAIIKDDKTYYQNQRVGKFSKTGKVDYSYLSTIVNSDKFLKELYRLLTASAQPNASSKDIDSISIPVPQCKNEQEAIASYFTNLDSLIQSSTKKIESLKQVKAASLQSMFPQEGETKPRVRFKGFEEEWEMVMVGKMGTTYSGLTGKTKEDFGQGDAKFVTFLNVLTNAKIDISILEHVNVCPEEHQNEVKKGDILFNTSSETPEEVGMCAVMDDELENVYLNSFCFGFRITDEHIEPTYIAYLMRSQIGRKIMSFLAQGATRYNLSKNSFCKAKLPVPTSREEQKAIADYFSNLDSQINLHSQRLEKLKQIKSACLDNMFV